MRKMIWKGLRDLKRYEVCMFFIGEGVEWSADIGRDC